MKAFLDFLFNVLAAIRDFVEWLMGLLVAGFAGAGAQGSGAPACPRGTGGRREKRYRGLDDSGDYAR